MSCFFILTLSYSSLQILIKSMSDSAQCSQDYSLLELAMPLRDEESFSINFLVEWRYLQCQG